ncbi:hypothetical protein MXB_223, partial [Myxobolus squamalis]
NKNEMPKLINFQKPIKMYEDEDPIFEGWGIPLEKDWRLDGVVSPVRNQLNCISCYAFSAVGAIESHYAIHTGNLKELSTQEIVDCSVSYGNLGCKNLLRAIFYLGPIPIGMDAFHQEFYYYDSGILDIADCSHVYLNHAVLAVGYNLTETPYLIVKNSYGTNWGIDGYFKIALHRNNMCGIASWVTLPYIAVEYNSLKN